MWKNIAESDRPQMTVWHMCSAHYITKATNTGSEYVILIVFQRQQWLHKRDSMLRKTYITFLVFIWRGELPCLYVLIRVKHMKMNTPFKEIT